MLDSISGPSWAHDDERRTLTVRVPAGKGSLTVSDEASLIDIQGEATLLVQGLHLIDAGGDALKIHSDAVVTVKGLKIERAARNGLSIAGSRYAVVEDNHIRDTGTDAIFFAEAAKVFVRRNVVHRAGLLGHPKAALAAINAHRTERAVIEDNLVDQTAYIGIRFSGDAHVRRNIVLRTCRLLSDCGAIYTWRRDPTHRPPASEIVNNTVADVRGDTQVKFSGEPYFMGIYLDDFTNDTTVSDNLVVDAGQGFTVKGLPNHILRNRFESIRGRAIITAFNRAPYPPDERRDNRLADNAVGSSSPMALQWPPGDVSIAPGTPVVIPAAGGRKLALGWVDWSRVDWARVAPGCKPAGWALARVTGDIDQQSTGLVLTCGAKTY